VGTAVTYYPNYSKPINYNIRVYQDVYRITVLRCINPVINSVRCVVFTTCLNRYSRWCVCTGLGWGSVCGGGFCLHSEDSLCGVVGVIPAVDVRTVLAIRYLWIVV